MSFPKPQTPSPSPYLLLLLLLALCVAGCTLSSPLPAHWSLSRVDRSFLASETTEPVGELSGGTTVSQSFWPSRDGLHTITLLFATYERANSGTVTFTLRDDAGQVVYQEQVQAARLADNHPHRFLFPPQPDSALRGYTLQVSGNSAPGAGVTLWADEADRYPGLLDRDAAYLSGDLLIEWGYKPTPGVLLYNGMGTLGQHGPTLLVTMLLWLLPGLALLAWLRAGATEAWSVQQLGGAALVLSGALLVLLPQLTALVGQRLGAWAVWLILIGSGAALGVARWRGGSLGPIERPGGATALYAALLALLLGSRLVALQSLIAPQWGDSIHHALITQLLLDHGGIFRTYEPYLPLGTFTYHAGFHLLAAWVGWSVPPGSSPMDGATAVLLAGQWLNGVAVVAVALLAEGLARWAGRPGTAQRAGVVALLVAGLLSEMPAFYLNWGRYTQLAGQIFLPAALLWCLTGWQRGQPRRWLVPGVLVVAALALTHYRVLMMYAAALPLIGAFVCWRGRGAWRPTLAGVGGRAVASGLTVGLLILPWYGKLLASTIVQRAAQMVSAPTRATSYDAQANALGDVTAFVGAWLLALAALALGWLLLRRHAAGLLLGGWLLALVVLSNPASLNLPGTGLVDNFMRQIALYLPLAALVGLGAGDGAAWLAERAGRGRRVLGWAGVAVLLGAGALGAWRQGQSADSLNFAMLTRPDEQAARWIEANTPPDAIFHTNGFFAYADAVVAGSDGGWWLWLTARRATTVPPMVYGHEAGIEPDYRQEINARFRRLHDAAPRGPAALAAALRAEGVEYVYIGAQQGRVGLPADEQPLNPLALRAHPAFELVYSDDFVWVFRVR